MTFAELEASGQPARPTCCSSSAPGPARKVVWCGQNSPGVVTDRERGPQGRRHRGAAELPAVATRRRRTSPTTATPRSSTSTPSSRRCSSGSAADIPKVEHILVFDGPAPAGMTERRRAHRPAPTTDRRAESRRPAKPGATMIYTSGTTGKPKGALRRGAGDPAQVGAMLGAHRLHARRHVHHDRAALPLAVRAGSWASRRRSARRSCCSASSTRRTGCASSTRTRSRRRSRAPTPIRMICNLPAEVKAKLRHVVDAA